MAEKCFPTVPKMQGFSSDGDVFKRFINDDIDGGPNPNREGVDVENLLKWRKRALEAAAGAARLQTYLTVAQMRLDVSQPVPTVGRVTNDPAPENNGDYVWDGSVWVWSGLQPINEEDFTSLSEAVDKKVSRSISGAILDILFSITDGEGRRTWIEANTLDGGPTAWAVSLLKRSLGIGETELPGVLFAITDKKGFATDLCVDSETGQFSQFVVDRLAKRLDIKKQLKDPEIYPTATGGQPGLFSSDMHWRDGEFLPVFTDMQKWAIWGSSTAQGFHSRLEALAASYGAVLYKGGKGSETLDETCARIGSRKALITFPGGVIPSAVSPVVVQVNFRNTAALGLRAFQGVVSGVLGTLSLDADRSTIYFTRAEAGALVEIGGPAHFTPIDGTAERASVCILNIGKNTLAAAQSLDEAKWCVDETDNAVAYLSPLVRRVVVLGHFQNTNIEIGGLAYQCIDAANRALKAKYGSNFLDLNEYLCSSQVWIDSGITPTQEDLDKQADGVKPPSLSQDAGHLNAIGYSTVTNHLIKPFFDSTGWYED